MNKKQRIVKEMARIVGCKQCGIHFRLLYHHRIPGTKAFNIGRDRTRNLPTLLKEMDKCDVLCRSCHQKIHMPGYQRQFVYPSVELWRGYWRVRFWRDKKLCKYFKTKAEAIQFANRYAMGGG